ncbi:MAG: Lrp/AsnC family transcriptional regulator [Paracoccaceae bacterium]
MAVEPLDERILAALRRNARQPVSSLAASLGIARATLRARIQKLESSGQILGYQAILPADLPQSPVRGLVMVDVEGRAADRVMAGLLALAPVGQVHTTNGRFDMIAEISSESLAEFDTILHRIRQIPGIGSTETHLLLQSRTARRMPA